MKSFTIVMAFFAVVGLVFFLGNPVIHAEDSVRIQSYSTSLPAGYKYFNNYPEGQVWEWPRDMGKARVTIQSYFESLPPGFTYSKKYYPNWQWPTTVETIQPKTDEYVAQGCPGFVYVEPELYNK